MAKAKGKITVDGKNENGSLTLKAGQGKRQVRSIDELLGYTSNPYASMSEEQYKDKLTNLSMSELQTHAAAMGILPITNRTILAKRLLNEYTKKAAGYYNTITNENIEPKNPKKLSELLRKMAN